MKYVFIMENKKFYTIEMMCRVLKVSRSAYHRWQSGKTFKRELRKENMKSEIQNTFSNTNNFTEVLVLLLNCEQKEHLFRLKNKVQENARIYARISVGTSHRPAPAGEKQVFLKYFYG